MARLGATVLLDDELEVHYVPILDDVILALLAKLPGLAAALLAAVGHVVLETGRLGLDEAALEVRMDGTGRLRRLRPDGNGPSTALGLAASEERL